MKMADKIEEKIRKELDIKKLTIENESYKHEGHVGDNGTGETHFRIKIASKDLDKLSRVQAHKSVLQALTALFDEGLHAVSLFVSRTDSES